MMTDTVITDLAIDKSKWKPVQLGDVVDESREVVRDPVKEGIERVVGLEHIDSESIHLRRWDTLAQSTTFTKKFTKGQVLFGRRRAYLKKAALSTFDGICSGDITVLQAKRDLMPELLPFLINNDKFFDYAVKNSAGSLSPRAKFKDLANYELLLPPKDQQARLAELLWAADQTIEALNIQWSKINRVFESVIAELCFNLHDFKTFRLAQLIHKLESGVSVNSEDADVSDRDIGILKTSSVSYGRFQPAEAKKVRKDELARLKTPVKGNSIIISRMNTSELVGANAYVDRDFDHLYLPDRLWQTVITTDLVNVKYLSYILSSRKYRRMISDLCSGTSNSMKNISQKDFLNLEINLPARRLQNEAVKKIEVTEELLTANKNHVAFSKELQNSLINQIF
ncbi:restriction endonuclease subunit S [Chryseolinea sp. T2]|uniref:restriction endonuclease subunit S n=1 Tax=Chryseolinea sp. T2 TaxID=3129255 RepID=UPI0030774528